MISKFGFIRVAAAIPNVALGDPRSNAANILSLAKQAAEAGASVVLFPELSVTGYSCADLFNQTLLLEQAETALLELSRKLPGGVLAVVGAPLRHNNRLFNCAIFLRKGEILAALPKTHLPNYNEFYEKRWFASAMELQAENPLDASVTIDGQTVPFGTDILVETEGVKLGAEICEDLWVPAPPSVPAARAGADIILNLSATDEAIGKHAYLRKLLSSHSASLRCGYVYSSAGWGESSTDLVFSGNALVYEDGSLLAAGRRFDMQPQLAISEIDVERLRNDRRRFSSFSDRATIPLRPYRIITSQPTGESEAALGYEAERRTGADGSRGRTDTEGRAEARGKLTRRIDPRPFVPSDSSKLEEHCNEIISIQAWGLARRLKAVGNGKVVVGISGGLDSTLALLVAVRTADMMGKPRADIIGVTMPGFGTTSRTHSNAVQLMKQLGVQSREICIGEAVRLHFSDIGQDPELHDATYENSQARERTQILMDLANKEGGIVLGTGDLSELALGWCTYNGDQMSMYGVNTSVPKTLVKYLVEWFAAEAAGRGEDETAATLRDIIATPISPELIPSAESPDSIGQKTEDLVGPYELHDFFLYHTLRNSFSPEKIRFLAHEAFGERYDDETIVKWLRTFLRRFFNQQFKRSCMPDGPKVGSVCLSPRGDWRMPSDASSAIWLSNADA